jgi:hypothetical protein
MKTSRPTPSCDPGAMISLLLEGPFLADCVEKLAIIFDLPLA